MKENNNFFDVYYQNSESPVFCYRSGNMVYEEGFEKGALITYGWNSAGYPLNVLTNCPTRINSKRYAEPFSFNIEIDGQSVDFGLEFEDFETEKNYDNFVSVLTLKSTIKPVKIKVHTLLDGTHMFSRWIEIENLSDKHLNISRLSVISGALESMDISDYNTDKNIEDYYSTGYFYDDRWGNEGLFKWNTLYPGNTCVDGRFTRNRFRHPLIFIKNNLLGKIWFAQIAWSGGYSFNIDYNAKKHESDTHLSFKAELTGHKPLMVLKPYEVYTTPCVHIGLVSGDFDDAVNEMHSHIRKSVLNMPEANGDKALINCGMGAEHTMNVEDSKAFIDQFAEMGGEIFTIDAGWVCPPGMEMEWQKFNGRNKPDPERYPDGIKVLADYTHKKGLKFGLWVDIESIGEYCDAHKNHPEWLSVNPLGEQSPKFMDLSIPECAQWCENELERIIEEYELDLLRVDHNVDYTEYFGMRDCGNRRLECVNFHHNIAVYKMYENLKKKFPDVIFENCAGGGGRTDLGMMKNFNHSWVSDWQKAPRSVMITNGMTMALPPERVDRLFAGMGCHTLGSLDFHIRNTMFGHISLNVISPAGAKWNTKEMEFIKHSLGIYKSFIRPFLPNAKIFHHTPDLTDTDNCILEISSPDKSNGAVGIFTLCGSGEKCIRIIPKGIDISKIYKVTLDNARESFEISGKELKFNGITVNIPCSLSSELVLYESI